MSRTIIHVDMDAFFASVEELDHPELAGKPLIVGGNATRRGVVAAANYAARRFGIHSAMPTAAALHRCPQATLLPPRPDRYSDISRQIRQIFNRYTPLVEPLSLDEAFLDITGSLRLFGTAEKIGWHIKDDIRRELGLIASVGIAPNKFLAKIASDIDKPDGFRVIAADEIVSFLSPLPVSRLWGVGAKTEALLTSMGIHTIGDLRSDRAATCLKGMGRAGEQLRQLALGIDQRPVIPGRAAKSISHETTFATDIRDGESLRRHLLTLTEQVARRLRQSGMAGRTVFIRLRHSDFHTVCRSRSLDHPADATQALWQRARQLFIEHWHGEPLRLIGMGVDQLVQKEEQQRQGELFDADSRKRQHDLDHIVDHIQEKFGAGAVQRAGGRIKP